MKTSGQEERERETGAGYGAAPEDDFSDAPDQAQPETREPPSAEEDALDDYANTKGRATGEG